MLRLLYFLIASTAASLLAGSPILATPGEAASQGTVRWAYYVPEDPSSLASLQQRQGQLDYVGLHWATIRADASLEMRANPEVIRLVRSLGAKPILSIILNGGADTARVLLASEESRAAAVEALLRATSEYDGISIDFEGMYPEQRDSFTRFMAQLAARFRPAGKLVTVALSAKVSESLTGWAAAHDYAALAPHGDLFILMAYGFRTARSTVPGSTAPMTWVEASLAYTLSQMPREKVLLGVPLYGYDWNTTAGPPARAMRYPESATLAGQYGAAIQRDAAQQSAYFAYSRDGQNHEVWFEDRASVEAKLALVPRYNLPGVALWRLGHEDPQIWPLLRVQQPATPTQAAPTPGAPTPPTPVATPGSTPALTATPIPTTTPQPAGGSGQGGATGPKRSWFFAEGSTAAPFDSWILLQNPGSVPAIAQMTFMVEGRGPITHGVLVGPNSRKSVFANQLVPSAPFSTRIDSDQPVFAERAMYAGFDGHDVTAISEPSRTWFFAEGSTANPFHTWILLQNPNPAPAVARLSFQLEDGTVVPREMWLGPNSRSSAFVNQMLPNAAFSTRVDSDQPIIAERAMYRFPGNAATGVTGTSAPSRNWFFPGGLPAYRNQPFDSWLLLQNPGGSAVTASVTFFGIDGQLSTIQRLLPPTSRQSIFVNKVFSGANYGIRVEANGEIIAERSVFLGPSGLLGGEPQGAYATQGAPQLGTVWVLPEGSTAAPFDEKISVLNPHNSPMQVRFEFMAEGGQPVVHNVTIAPQRNLDLEVDGLIPSAGISTRVSTSLPSAVERTMFWSKEGKMGAHNTVGIRLE